eukprot:CAMPEP_0184415150 /NCGR_PEP_ID=MMETSP0738-20130409/8541_1 /TAXON_ID=385413 /ORGANISM="Thalassiosira miniscula, Strain CCMP1093" /LENGTH=81 /DNA_ID=CAMNT_0026774319 /DNA_START=350 /DNA_END=592 /DNA_ORIENTATION=+
MSSAHDAPILVEKKMVGLPVTIPLFKNASTDMDRNKHDHSLSSRQYNCSLSHSWPTPNIFSQRTPATASIGPPDVRLAPAG